MPKLVIKDYEDGRKLEAEVKVTSEDLIAFKKLVEEHYKNDPREDRLYQPPEPKKRLSFLEDKKGGKILNFFRNERGEETFPSYECFKDKIFLRTSKGKLEGHIDRESYLSANINGKIEFVSDFYKLLEDISNKP